MAPAMGWVSSHAAWNCAPSSWAIPIIRSQKIYIRVKVSFPFTPILKEKKGACRKKYGAPAVGIGGFPAQDRHNKLCPAPLHDAEVLPRRYWVPSRTLANPIAR